MDWARASQRLARQLRATVELGEFVAGERSDERGPLDSEAARAGVRASGWPVGPRCWRSADMDPARAQRTQRMGQNGACRPNPSSSPFSFPISFSFLPFYSKFEFKFS
jgi:hypothetical protein